MVLAGKLTLPLIDLFTSFDNCDMQSSDIILVARRCTLLRNAMGEEEEEGDKTGV